MVRFRRALKALLVMLPLAAALAPDSCRALTAAEREAAVRFCISPERGAIWQKHAVVLDEAKTTACYYGELVNERRESDLDALASLADGGTFVIRSHGGYSNVAIEIADLLRSKNAVVVALDYCLSACANYILVATAEAHVFRNTLVATHNSWATCYDVSSTYGEARCSRATYVDLQRHPDIRRFLESRRQPETLFSYPPQSALVADRLRALSLNNKQIDDELRRSAVWWTLSPAYLQATFKTKITYEGGYLDRHAAERHARRVGIVRIIHDPQPDADVQSAATNAPAWLRPNIWQTLNFPEPQR